MTLNPTRLPEPVPMEQGLLAWTRTQGSDMWHEIANGIDYADPHATIDLLLAAQWITRQGTCCRATALLLLARMVAANLHHAGPPQLEPDAARVMARHLHRRLAEGRFPQARFHLTEPQRDLVVATLGPDGVLPLPLPVLTCGTRIAQPPHAFLGWRPVAALPALSLVA